MNFAAFICFALAFALIVFLRLTESESVIMWYNKYTDTLDSFERWIQAYGATWYSVLIILFNFALKSFIPWFPISCICVATSVLFKWYFSMAIDIIGLAILFSINYHYGKRKGGGNAEKILSKYDKAHNFVDSSKLGSAVVLFFLRLIPCLPINSVSRLYGTTDIGYGKYLVVSLLGFSYKLFTYTIIGRSVYDPMSARFFVPFILLFVFSGFALLGLNGVIGLTKGQHSEEQ